MKLLILGLRTCVSFGKNFKSLVFLKISSRLDSLYFRTFNKQT